MRYWWVNQNQTHREELRGHFMWSPKRTSRARNPFYDTMREVSPGDVVFSFWDTRIKAIAIVTARAETGPKPDFGTAGANWSQEGWYVQAEYVSLDNQIRPKDHIEILRPFLPSKYSPLQTNGDGLQSVYLAEVPQPFADALIGLIGQAYWDAYAVLTASQNASMMSDAEDDIIDHTLHGQTFRELIVKARRGQGVFRSNVLLRESRCRVTGVSEPRHLKASHIKPWRIANDAERLDGANGLLFHPTSIISSTRATSRSPRIRSYSSFLKSGTICSTHGESTPALASASSRESRMPTWHFIVPTSSSVRWLCDLVTRRGPLRSSRPRQSARGPVRFDVPLDLS